MDAFSICELIPLKAGRVNVFNPDRSLRRKISPPDSFGKVGGDSAKWRALKVMVVDDKQGMAGRLVKLIRRCGHAACLAGDSRDARRVFAVRHPDIVFLDMEMPLTDGCQFASQMRSEFPNGKYITIATKNQAGGHFHQQCNDAGIDLVLTKPVNPSVVEMLLMLEWVRVNRLKARRTATLVRKNSSTFSDQNPLIVSGDVATATTPSRPIGDVASGQQSSKRSRKRR